jgi:hypothetical protein
MLLSCEHVRAEYENLKTLKQAFDAEFASAVQTGDLAAARALRAELTVKLAACKNVLDALFEASPLGREFNRQIATLAKPKFANAAGMGKAEWRALLLPLKEKVKMLARQKLEVPAGHIPFVIVIRNDVIGIKHAVPLIELEGKNGFTNMSAGEIGEFKQIEGVEIPSGSAYLAIDVAIGMNTLGKTADEAIEMIKQEDRSPLTLEEGVAIVTHFPRVLVNEDPEKLYGEKYLRICMPGSRSGDNRTAQFMVDFENKPELRWYWSNAAHLNGIAFSCRSRV